MCNATDVRPTAPAQDGARWRLEPFGQADWAQARALLLACYPQTPAALWDRGFARLRQVPGVPADQPLGRLLLGPEGPMGVALLLGSTRPRPGGVQHVVNGSSWAILPAARERALWMARHGMAELTTTYTALTPIPSTVKLLQRIGFEASTHQQVLAWTPRLAWGVPPSGQPDLLDGREAALALRDDPLAQALEDHRRLGCLVWALRNPLGSGGWSPLVWRRTRRLRHLPAAELLYAPSQALVAQHARVLAARLLRRGYGLLAFDAHQDLVPDFPCTRLFLRRFARCPLLPQGVDHLYSELVYLHR